MATTTSAGDNDSEVLDLRAGDWVEVRSQAEILATLDARGRLDGMPFMPEMLEFCGRRLRVFRRAHKTCDTVNQTGGRRLTHTVHLEESATRCSGAAHGGCEAACLLFWKEAWLKRSGPATGLVRIRPKPSTSVPQAARNAGCTEAALTAATLHPTSEDPTSPTYVCQATALPAATTLLPWWDVRQYVEDYTSGNVSLREMAESFAFSGFLKVVRYGDQSPLHFGKHLVRAYDFAKKLTGGVRYPERKGTQPAGTEFPPYTFGAKAGDLVRVKPYDALWDALDQNNKNRGMYLGAEETLFCGQTFPVRATVKKIINERTGKIIRLRGTSVILEGVWCKACYADRRLFCPRSIYPFWREAWLEPVQVAAQGGEVR